MTNEIDQDKLAEMAFKTRKHIIKMACNGGCFIGASLSAVDIIVYLYREYLQVFDIDDKDYFLLSKGHDVPALYGCLVEMGKLDENRIDNHLSIDDDIYWHPNMNVKGVDFYQQTGTKEDNTPIGILIPKDKENDILAKLKIR